jgi:hypothetical protein
VDWTTTPPTHDNYQFTNVTIAAGHTLTVWSGTVIRATGTFTNNGTILVGTGANGGFGCMSTGGLAYSIDAGPNLLGYIAGDGDVAASGVQIYGGIGYGPNAAFARQIVNVGPIAGGGGAGNGGTGGGGLTVLAKGALVNSATGIIDARGEDATDVTGCGVNAGDGGGGGGGGGGVVVLASKVSIAQSGNIDVSGGGGGPSSVSFAAGGGGSGGIVHLFAPAVTHTGTETLDPGPQGTTTIATTTTPRGAGASGGSTGGLPGSGNGLDTAEAVVAGVAGTAGQTYTSLFDPSALFY